VAAKKNSFNKILGLILLIVGIGLVFWGYNLSESVGSQLNRALTGSYGNKIMTLYIAGAACLGAGLFSFWRSR